MTRHTKVKVQYIEMAGQYTKVNGQYIEMTGQYTKTTYNKS